MPSAQGQETGGDRPAAFDARVKDAGEPSGGSRLPAWIKIGGELRARVESGNEFDSAPYRHSYLNRLRLDVTVQPRPWMRFFFQGQDARALALGSGQDVTDLGNTLDVHQGYVAFGNEERGWQLKAGRQELEIGDEWMVSADSDWDCFGYVFDAVRLGFQGESYRLDAFTGFRVEPEHNGMDHLDRSSRVSGASVQFKTRGEDFVEPYFLWKRGGDTLDLSGNPGHRDVLSPGLRAQGAISNGVDYGAEMVLQRGHVVADRIAAWAGHWEVGWQPLGDKNKLHLSLGYSYASGDEDPGDTRHATFDDMYPAGYTSAGTPEPLTWRNTRSPSLSVEVPLSRRWTLEGGYRHYWLATTNDGLYLGGDEYLVRNPSAGRTEIGSYPYVAASYAPSSRWQFHAGYGRLFPGAYLRQSGYPTPLSWAFLQSGFAF